MTGRILYAWGSAKPALAKLARGLLVALAALPCGCQRKAPGPDECLAFAEAWIRAAPPEVGRRLTLDQAFEDLTLRCLTEPYDRELVACVVGRSAPLDRCRIDFVRRKEARREPQ